MTLHLWNDITLAETFYVFQTFHLNVEYLKPFVSSVFLFFPLQLYQIYHQIPPNPEVPVQPLIVNIAKSSRKKQTLKTPKKHETGNN